MSTGQGVRDQQVPGAEGSLIPINVSYDVNKTTPLFLAPFLFSFLLPCYGY